MNFKLHNEDSLTVLKSLDENCIDMIWGDPDYNVGINYNGSKYTQKWDDYIAWYCELASECMRVLKPSGNLFMMNYPKQNAYLRVLCLDKLAYDVQDYVWVYNTNVGHSPKRFTTAHRSILHATKTKQSKFYKDEIALPYQNLKDKRIIQRMAKGCKGRMPYSWFYFDLVKNVSKDKTFHSCQIPTNLTQMFIKSCTKEGDSVFVLFGGSGGEIMLCEKLKRKWLSCELHKPYFDMIQDRLERKGEIRDEFRLNAEKKEVEPNLFKDII
ncbi:DNA-methyltransferase [Campylobacter troglodytis]|uniref:DNA-methyltransferase n=1 Tax=Campylobacter troglodytis TaxID=654363 RepID=UPI00115BD057|nr:site-specific DNA-methyltransferase [Campylobacter troglodytis]TQR60227.1 site-specific DNA-methyltransferase [Campylobacter troglodytis]